jgi:hypothetical protein
MRKSLRRLTDGFQRGKVQRRTCRRERRRKASRQRHNEWIDESLRCVILRAAETAESELREVEDARLAPTMADYSLPSIDQEIPRDREQK